MISISHKDEYCLKNIIYFVFCNRVPQKLYKDNRNLIPAITSLVIKSHKHNLELKMPDFYLTVSTIHWTQDALVFIAAFFGQECQLDK